MKKAFLILLSVLAIFLSGCTYRIDKPQNTNLEFWITEQTDSWNLEGYQPKYGMFGGRQYYGTGYTPTYDENDRQIDPEFCVIYTITSYPDHSSNKSAITEIYISDPEVYVYGLTLNSDDEEIKKVMKEEGFKNTENLIFTKNKVEIRFGDKDITISYDVSNVFGIQF